MNANWTTEQILALAPDPAAARAGRDLSSSHKWQAFARNEAAVWGQCKGSAAEPYKTVIDLAQPAFKCTCPSRKFPCKHGLGLFLIYASQPASIPTGDVPPWAAEWLTKRAEKPAAKAAEKPKTAEDEARLAEQQQKRASKRAARVEDGVEELRLWLQDLMREGFRELPSRPRQFWDQPAARMVDAQAPGLARRLQEMATIPYSGTGWPERLLIRVGRLHLLLEGHRRLDTLPDDLKQEVRTHLGFSQPSEEVLASGERVSDVWSVMCRRVSTEDRPGGPAHLAPGRAGSAVRPGPRFRPGARFHPAARSRPEPGAGNQIPGHPRLLPGLAPPPRARRRAG